MRKYILMALMALVASPVWAGSAMSSATISETLTLTSPSAVISMTGASATAYLRNVSVTGVISATTVSATNVSATNITSRGVAKAWGYINARVSPSVILASYNVASTTRLSTGKEIVTFTSPLTSAFYAITLTPVADNVTGAICSSVGNTAAAAPSPTTTGFQLDLYNCSGGQRDTGYFFTVFGN